MRKTLSMLLLAAALPAAAIAAEPGHSGYGMGPDDYHHQGRDGMPGMMGPMHGLDLTPEQRKAAQNAYRQAAKEKREITQRYLDKLSEADREAMRKELQASRDKADKAFRAQLTPEQLKSFDERKAEQEKRRAEWEEFRKWKAEKEGRQN